MTTFYAPAAFGCVDPKDAYRFSGPRRAGRPDAGRVGSYGARPNAGNRSRALPPGVIARTVLASEPRREVSASPFAGWPREGTIRPGNIAAVTAASHQSLVQYAADFVAPGAIASALGGERWLERMGVSLAPETTVSPR